MLPYCGRTLLEGLVRDLQVTFMSSSVKSLLHTWLICMYATVDVRKACHDACTLPAAVATSWLRQYEIWQDYQFTSKLHSGLQHNVKVYGCIRAWNGLNTHPGLQVCKSRWKGVSAHLVICAVCMAVLERGAPGQ